jgi:hypothetical protein
MMMMIMIIIIMIIMIEQFQPDSSTETERLTILLRQLAQHEISVLLGVAIT